MNNKTVKPILLVLKDLARVTETNSTAQPIGYSFPYGGTQFGDYNDLGDGRSALVAWDYESSLSNIDSFKGIEFILKGNMTTVFTPEGLDGKLEFSSLENIHYMSERLHAQGLPTELFRFRSNIAGIQIQLIRPTILRVGTFQYLYKHHPNLIRPCLEHLLSRTDYSNITTMFSAIVKGYRDIADKWEDLRFVHGCLNTDNVCAIPCAIDLSSSYIANESESDKCTELDVQGRYSLSNQKTAIVTALQTYHFCIESELDMYNEDNLRKDWDRW